MYEFTCPDCKTDFRIYRPKGRARCSECGWEEDVSLEKEKKMRQVWMCGTCEKENESVGNKSLFVCSGCGAKSTREELERWGLLFEAEEEEFDWEKEIDNRDFGAEDFDRSRQEYMEKHFASTYGRLDPSLEEERREEKNVFFKVVETPEEYWRKQV